MNTIFILAINELQWKQYLIIIGDKIIESSY